MARKQRDSGCVSPGRATPQIGIATGVDKVLWSYPADFYKYYLENGADDGNRTRTIEDRGILSPLFPTFATMRAIGTKLYAFEYVTLLSFGRADFATPAMCL
jgi:hypothetical protein